MEWMVLAAGLSGILTCSAHAGHKCCACTSSQACCMLSDCKYATAHALCVCSVHHYDKDLFEGVAHNISHNFTKFDTAQLLKVHWQRSG